jgi:hypothetical protein
MAADIQPSHLHAVYRFFGAVWHVAVVSARAIAHLALQVRRRLHPDSSADAALSRSERKRLRKERIRELSRHKR